MTVCEYWDILTHIAPALRQLVFIWQGFEPSLGPPCIAIIAPDRFEAVRADKWEDNSLYESLVGLNWLIQTEETVPHVAFLEMNFANGLALRGDDGETKRDYVIFKDLNIDEW